MGSGVSVFRIHRFIATWCVYISTGWGVCRGEWIMVFLCTGHVTLVQHGVCTFPQGGVCVGVNG